MIPTRPCRLAVHVLFVAALHATPARAAAPDVQRVAEQFREFAMGEATGRGERLLDDVEAPKTPVDGAGKWLDTLSAEGSWPDIDYASAARSGWRPFAHLTRLLSLTAYARRPDTKPAASAAAIAGVHRGMAYWAGRDPQCPNWWYNQIGVPKILGTVAILLDADLTPAERTFVTDVALPRAKVGAMTGQNRVWLAANGLMRGVLTGDEALATRAAAVIRDEVRVGTGEGVQPDDSFHQHGPQQQFGNYGMAYAVEMTRWATVLRGTPFAFPDDKLATVRGFLLGGENWVVWRGAVDVSACGRQLFPGSPLSKAATFAGVMSSMSVVDPRDAPAYLGFVARNKGDAPANDLVGDKYFWRSDHLVHRRPGWCATLKMSSSRVVGGETVNNENLSGLHLADGATFFYRDGREYADVFPVWDWRKVPGTTAAQDDHALVWPKQAAKPWGTDFVGGVTDAGGACAAMNFDRDGLTAKKAWFLAGDVVVCLGADVRSAGSAPVVTTVNQSLLRGRVRVSGGPQVSEFADGDVAGSTPMDVEHDGFRYVVPAAQKWSVAAGRRTGNWKRVFDSPATPKEDVAVDVFALTLDHGAAPAGGTYAYYVLPAAEPHEGRVEVVVNTPARQAVIIDGKWLGAAFRDAGAMQFAGVELRVDQPCVLLVDARAAGAPRLTVADPTQKLKTIRVTAGGATRDVALPQGSEAGASVTAGG